MNHDSDSDCGFDCGYDYDEDDDKKAWKVLRDTEIFRRPARNTCARMYMCAWVFTVYLQIRF